MHRESVYHPQFGAVVNVAAAERPADDEAATAQTIALMSKFAIEDSRNELVRRAAAAAIAAFPGRPHTHAVWGWIREHVRFEPDADLARPFAADADSAEVLVRPVDLLTMPKPAGDCDDFSMLAAAILRALGIDSSFKTVAADPADPAAYSHVYVIAGDGTALDVSHGPYPGWEVQPLGKSRVWPLEKPMQNLGKLPDWAIDLMKTGADAGAKIAAARYAVPQLQRGASIERSGPGGSEVLQRYPTDVYFGGTTGTFGGMGMVLLLLGGLGLFAVFALQHKERQ